MVEAPNSSGVEKSSSLKNLKDGSRGDSPTGKPPSQLNKNPSQKASDMTPLNTKKGAGEESNSSVRRNQRSKRGSVAGESGDSPTKRKGGGGGNSLGEGR